MTRQNHGRFASGSTAAVAAVALSLIAAAPGTEVAVVEKSPAVPTVQGDLSPEPYERDIARIVADMLAGHHYEKKAIDDDTSRRWFDNYLEVLDPWHNVFLQTDIDEFRAKYATKLDDTVEQRLPDLEPALDIYRRYRERLGERARHAMTIAEGPIDLTNAETYVPDRSELPWPATVADANDLWRKRVEEELIEGLIDGRDDEPKIRSNLMKRYERMVRSADERDSVDVLEVWLGSLCRAFDPHSTWMKPAVAADFDIDITNSVEGIGAQLSLDEDYVVVVKDVVPGGPAFKNGRVKKEDRILAVAQGDAEPIDVVGMKLEDVVKLIRGPKETVVKLTVQHAGAEPGQTEVIDLVRARVILEESAAVSHIEEIDGDKLGYVELPKFYVDGQGRKAGRRASQDLRNEIEELKAQGAEGLVLDLRNNGGGSLVEAIDVAGLFLPAGPIVQVRDRQGRIEALFDSDPTVAWAGPLVVLTNAHSASASEIVAGALQDYGRAVIVGDKATHGKGTVQQVAALTGQLRGQFEEEVGGDLKLTVQKFYRVSGGSTQNKGVEADLVLPSWLDGLEVHESDLDYALLWDRIPPAPHVRTGELAPLLPKLQERSKARVAADEDFRELAEMIALREAEEAKNEWSLVLEARKQEYEERKAKLPKDMALEAEEEDAADLTPEEQERKEREADYVLDEGMRVIEDLVQLMGSPTTTAGTD